MQSEVGLFEDNLRELDTKIQDAKKRRGEIVRQVEDMQKQPTKFKPSQVDTCLLNLDELSDRS